MYSKTLALFLILFLHACATTKEQLPAQISAVNTKKISSDNITHIVQKGQTLWRICKIYGADLEAIVQANKIHESTSITVGQAIIIPKSKFYVPLAQTNFSPKDNANFIWPTKGKITCQFKQKLNGVSNKGIDITTPPDQDVFASHDGRVIFAGNLVGYGETLIIEHRDEISTVYCGNSDIAVKIGDNVKQGVLIAKTGKSARQDSGTLHFEIRRKNKPQNPLYYLD